MDNRSEILAPHDGIAK